MKKTLSIVALSALFVGAVFAADAKKSWFDGVALNASVGFESEYVYRGHRIAQDTLVTSLEGAYKLYNGSLYAGVLNHNSMKSAFGESDFYVGYKLPVYEKFTADVGYTYYWYTLPAGVQDTDVDRRNEIYAGAIYNGAIAGLNLSPAAYIYYDFNSEAITGEGSVKYSFDLAKYGAANTALDLGAYIGGVTANDMSAGQSAKVHSGYMYYGITADAVYSFSKTAAGSVGLRYGGNNHQSASFVNNTFADQNNLWWGAKFSAGF